MPLEYTIGKFRRITLKGQAAYADHDSSSFYHPVSLSLGIPSNGGGNISSGSIREGWSISHPSESVAFEGTSYELAPGEILDNLNSTSQTEGFSASPNGIFGGSGFANLGAAGGDGAFSRLADGNFASAGVLAISHSSSEIDLTYDFGEDNKQFLGKLRISFRDDYCSSFDVLVSKDGLNFTTVKSYTNLTASDANQTSIYTNHVGEIGADLGGSGLSNVNIDNDDNYPGFQNETSGGPGGIPTYEAYRAFRLKLKRFNSSSTTFKSYVELREVTAFIVDPGDLFYKEYDAEFDDSLLSLSSYTNPRFNGSKLIGQAVNRYSGQVAIPSEFPDNISPSQGEYKPNNKGFLRWGGDITYGINPVVENKIAAVYLSNTIIGAGTVNDPAENDSIVRIANHSYVTMERILLINTATNEVEIVNRAAEDPLAFKRSVTTDFPEGSICKIYTLDESIQTNLKDFYRVKFNRGQLMKLYSYEPNTDGFEDGVFGGFGVRNLAGNFAANLASGSETLQDYDALNTNPGGNEGIGGGLFSFGMTAQASASLFNTNSISFVRDFPSELAVYDGEVDLAIQGTQLHSMTQSFSSEIGIGVVDDSQMEFYIDGGGGG